MFIEKEKLTKDKLLNKLIFIIILTITVLIISIFILLPTIKEINTLARGIENQYIQLERVYLKGQLLRKMRKEFVEIEPEIKKLSNVFIKEGEELQFITHLEKIADQYNLTQKLVLQEPVALEGNPLFGSMSLQLTLAGDFNNFLKYLRELEVLDWFTKIESLNIAEPETKSFFEGSMAVKDLNYINILMGGNTYKIYGGLTRE